MTKARQAERSRSLKPNQLLLSSGALITERPILFSTEMIRANLEGRKTQTRRTKGLDVPTDLQYDKIEFNPIDWPKKPLIFKKKIEEIGNSTIYEITAAFKSPYGKPGDLLWCRETFYEEGFRGNWAYKASTGLMTDYDTWKPSIHMPKEAARIWAMVQEIRAERLQDISEEDAIAEGVQEFEDGTFKNYYTKKGLRAEDGVECLLAKGSFQSLWTSINGMDSWDANPWVWVVRYRILSTHGRPSLEEIEQAYLEISNS